MKTIKHFAIFSFLALTALIVSGCAEEKSNTENTDGDTNTSTTADSDHSGWWCVEHAIPEEECSMCSAKYAAQCKEKGDWCEEHNRAQSQCFICDPSLAEKYVKLYEAKYGKKPPAATH